MSKSEFKISKKKFLKDNDNNKNIRSHSNNRNVIEEDIMSEEEEDQQFPIEKIIARKLSKPNGKLLYLIKWLGYSYEESTWESMKNLIEDYCFQIIYDYENLSVDEKIALLKEWKHLKQLKRITEDNIRKTEECEELQFFRNNYQDFNPDFRELLENWE